MSNSAVCLLLYAALFAASSGRRYATPSEAMAPNAPRVFGVHKATSYCLQHHQRRPLYSIHGYYDIYTYFGQSAINPPTQQIGYLFSHRVPPPVEDPLNTFALGIRVSGPALSNPRQIPDSTWVTIRGRFNCLTRYLQEQSWKIWQRLQP